MILNVNLPKKKAYCANFMPFLVFSSNLSNFYKNCYPLSFPILGLRDSTRALQCTPSQNLGGKIPWAWRRTNGQRTEILVSNIGQKISKSQKIQKNLKKSLKKINKNNNFNEEKKCYPLSFPILGGCDSTRALQSSPVQKYENLKKSQNYFFQN